MRKRKPLVLPSTDGEVWKQFHPNYYISNMGRVYSRTKKTVVVPQKNNWGYFRFRIRIAAKKRKWVFAHSLVVKIFGDIHGNTIPEVGINRRKITIDHIDGNKANNTQSNLEVVTALENNLRKRAAESQRKKVNQLCARTAQTPI